MTKMKMMITVLKHGMNWEKAAKEEQHFDYPCPECGGHNVFLITPMKFRCNRCHCIYKVHIPIDPQVYGPSPLEPMMKEEAIRRQARISGDMLEGYQYDAREEYGNEEAEKNKAELSAKITLNKHFLEMKKTNIRIDNLKHRMDCDACDMIDNIKPALDNIKGRLRMLEDNTYDQECEDEGEPECSNEKNEQKQEETASDGNDSIATCNRISRLEDKVDILVAEIVQIKKGAYNHMSDVGGK